MMDTTKRRRVRAGVLAGAAAVGLLALPAPPASAITTSIPITSRVSTATGGGQLALGQYDDPRLDATGRYVFFSTGAAVVAADTNGDVDVYRKDRLTGRTELVSLLDEDTLLPEGGRLCDVTPNGRYLVFNATGTGAAGPVAKQLFRRDLQTKATVLVSQDGGKPGNQGADRSPCGISADGNRVAFSSDSTNLGSATPGQIYLRKIDSDSTTIVSRSSGGTIGNGTSFQASISDDGGVVAFHSASTNLVSGDVNGQGDIFVRVLTSNTTQLVSTTAGGQASNGDTQSPALSSNGRYVAFTSSATNLVADDDNAAYDIFRKDRQTGAVARVSVSSSGAEANGGSASPSITPDGRYVSFTSKASNLYAADANGEEDTFRRDLDLDRTDLASRRWSGVAAGNDETIYGSDLSSDGRVVAFISSATDLVPGDTNGTWDSFVRDFGVDLAPFGSAKAFAKQQLIDFGPSAAAPTTAAIDADAVLLQTGAHAPDGLIAAKARSTSWSAKRAPLIRLYWAFFLRAPDPSGMQYWTNKLAAGATLAQVASKFAQSPEFQTKYGAKTNQQFVTLIYQNIFERDPDPAGLAYWTGKLDAKAKTRGDVMTNFSESNEGRRFLAPQVDTITIWLGMLRTMPPKAELAQWIADIRSGAKVAEQVATTIRSLPAYAARVTA